MERRTALSKSQRLGTNEATHTELVRSGVAIRNKETGCGEHALFGFDTTINEAGRIVRFDYDTEHTIRITPMRDGNLPVKHIPLGKF